jgi:hypothetical protein
LAGRSWQGGHSLVALVLHEASEEQLVLKRLRSDGDAVKAALINESDIMRALHPFHRRRDAMRGIDPLSSDRRH